MKCAIHGSGTATGPTFTKSTMTTKTPSDHSWSLTADLPRPRVPRPSLQSHQSNSLPSTPYQKPLDGLFAGRSPSPRRNRLSSSPRSSHSDFNHHMPITRRHHGGCKYETGMAQARRRMAYSLGGDKLKPVPISAQAYQTAVENSNLSDDMRALYDRLLPTIESESRRNQFLVKLQTLLQERWPGHSIAVNVFGSTGNNLGTSDSDVDICISTDCKAMEHVCSIAELLAKNGMERVVCVSSAKVPIVKIWDPVLQLACDMNVNNPVALENTAMIRTYVDIDPRVRPLAMIIKHWTKRRILNEPGKLLALHQSTWAN